MIFLICQFNFIGLVSGEDVYILKNSNPNKMGKSEWTISKCDLDNFSYSEKGQIDPEGRQELNDMVHEYREKYGAIFNEESILCLNMPSELLSDYVKKIERLLK